MLSPQDEEFLNSFTIGQGLKLEDLDEEPQKLLRIVGELKKECESNLLAYKNAHNCAVDLMKERDGLKEELASWHKHLDPCKDCGHRQFVPHTCNP